MKKAGKGKNSIQFNLFQQICTIEYSIIYICKSERQNACDTFIRPLKLGFAYIIMMLNMVTDKIQKKKEGHHKGLC